MMTTSTTPLDLLIGLGPSLSDEQSKRDFEQLVKLMKEPSEGMLENASRKTALWRYESKNCFRAMMEAPVDE